MATLRLGIIGCGSFARRYHLPVLYDHPTVNVPLICDTAPTPEIVSAADRFGARIVETPDEMFADGGCDAVLISTPHACHYGYARQALLAGRHTLTDKPLVLHRTEAEELTKIAAQAGLVAAVAFNRRFDRACLRAREIIRDGGIGAVCHVQGVQLGYEPGWVLDPVLSGGGMFWGRGSHLIDLVPWLTAAPPRRVRSQLRPGTPARTDFGGFIDVEFGDFSFKLVCIEDGWHMWDELRIYGSSGLIELRRPSDASFGWALTWQRDDGFEERLACDETPGHATLDFIRTIETGRSQGCSFAEAIQSVRLIESAFQSAGEDERWVDV